MQLRFFGIPPIPYQGTINYRDPAGVDRDITAADFFRLTGAAYSTRTFETEKYAETEREHIPSKAVRDITLHGIPSDKKVRLAHVDELVGLGVIANTNIKKGENVVAYRGVLQTREEDKGNTTYCWQDNNAASFRSLAACVNHSFPNVMSRRAIVDNLTGVIFFAVEDIPAGEQICVEYYRELERLGPHAELRYEAMRNFVKASPLPGENDLNDETVAGHQWNYILMNPSSMLLLYLDGLLTRQNVKELLMLIPAREFWVSANLTKKIGGQYLRFDVMLRYGMRMLDEKIVILKQEHPDLFLEIRAYFNALTSQTTAIGALYAFAVLAEKTVLDSEIEARKQSIVNQVRARPNPVVVPKEESILMTPDFWRTVKPTLTEAANSTKFLFQKENTTDEIPEHFKKRFVMNMLFRKMSPNTSFSDIRRVK